MSFDDEIDVLKDWTHITPYAMTINDGHHSSWEYSRKKVMQAQHVVVNGDFLDYCYEGQMFHEKVHLQHTVQQWAYKCTSVCVVRVCVCLNYILHSMCLNYLL
jgi:hypothetical protein